MDELEATVITLRQQLQVYRKRDKDQEITGVHKRLKKTNDKIITSFRDYMEAQGGTEEEIELLDDQQPSVFKVQLDQGTRQRQERRVKATARRNNS